MLKTELLTARSIDEHAILTDGNVLLEKSYDATDDKFILVFMRMEDVRTVVALTEEGSDEADDVMCRLWIENTTMIVVKPDTQFQVTPDDVFGL